MKMVEENNYIPYKKIIADHDFCRENKKEMKMWTKNVLEQIFSSKFCPELHSIVL